MLWFVEGRNLLVKTSFVEWVPEGFTSLFLFITRPFEGFVSYLQASEWEQRVVLRLQLFLLVAIMPVLSVVVVLRHQPRQRQPGFFYRLNSWLLLWVYTRDSSRANRDIEGRSHYLNYIASLREVVPVDEVNACILYLLLAFVSLHLKAILLALFGVVRRCNNLGRFYNSVYSLSRRGFEWGLSISTLEPAVYLKALSAIILWDS